MAGKSDSEKNAAELLQAARTIPGQDTDFAIPSLFNPNMGMSPLVDTRKDPEKPSVRVRMQCHTRTFVLWRPYEKCARCQDMITQNIIELPEYEGDHTCPHTQQNDYQEIINRILKGDCLKQFEEFFTLKNGVRGVQLVWLAPDPEFLKEMEKKRKTHEDAVYPPRPDKVFAAPIEGEEKHAEGSPSSSDEEAPSN